LKFLSALTRFGQKASFPDDDFFRKEAAGGWSRPIFLCVFPDEG
jgi:hypothetical protein